MCQHEMPDYCRRPSRPVGVTVNADPYDSESHTSCLACVTVAQTDEDIARRADEAWRSPSGSRQRLGELKVQSRVDGS